MPVYDWSNYEGESGAEDVPLLLSVRSQQIVLSAMQHLDNRSYWLDEDEDEDGTIWEDIQSAVAEAYEEICEEQSVAQETISGASITRTTNQIITSTTAWQPISFDSQFYDTGGYWDFNGQPTRLTVQQNGLYLVTANVLFNSNASGDTARREAGIRVDGGDLIAFSSGVIVSQLIGLTLARTLLLDANSYVTLEVRSQAASLAVIGNALYTPLLSIEMLR
jgi:hypothetical protein